VGITRGIWLPLYYKCGIYNNAKSFLKRLEKGQNALIITTEETLREFQLIWWDDWYSPFEHNYQSQYLVRSCQDLNSHTVITLIMPMVFKIKIRLKDRSHMAVYITNRKIASIITSQALDLMSLATLKSLAVLSVLSGHLICALSATWKKDQSNSLKFDSYIISYLFIIMGRSVC